MLYWYISFLRLIKSNVRSTTGQAGLNHLMLKPPTKYPQKKKVDGTHIKELTEQLTDKNGIRESFMALQRDIWTSLFLERLHIERFWNNYFCNIDEATFTEIFLGIKKLKTLIVVLNEVFKG